MEKRQRRYTIRSKQDSFTKEDKEWRYTTDSLNVAKDKFLKYLFLNDQYVTTYDNKIGRFIIWNNASTANDHPIGVLYFNTKTLDWTKEKLY